MVQQPRVHAGRYRRSAVRWATSTSIRMIGSARTANGAPYEKVAARPSFVELSLANRSHSLSRAARSGRSVGAQRIDSPVEARALARSPCGKGAGLLHRLAPRHRAPVVGMSAPSRSIRSSSSPARGRESARAQVGRSGARHIDAASENDGQRRRGSARLAWSPPTTSSRSGDHARAGAGARRALRRLDRRCSTEFAAYLRHRRNLVRARCGMPATRVGCASWPNTART
jgi:hypothetical protein